MDFLEQAERELRWMYERQGRELWAKTRQLLVRSYLNGLRAGQANGVLQEDAGAATEWAPADVPAPSAPQGNGDATDGRRQEDAPATHGPGLEAESWGGRPGSSRHH
jgi:hypothetical protein